MHARPRPTKLGNDSKQDLDPFVLAERAHPEQLATVAPGRFGRREGSVVDRVRDDGDPPGRDAEQIPEPLGDRRADGEQLDVRTQERAVAIERRCVRQLRFDRARVLADHDGDPELAADLRGDDPVRETRGERE